MASAPVTDFDSTISSEQVNGTPPRRQLPEHSSTQAVGIRDIARMYGDMATQAFRLGTLSARTAFSRSRRSVTQTSARASGSVQNLVTRTKDEANYLRQEHPVRLLSILAGTALLAGAAIRIWRSQVQ